MRKTVKAVLVTVCAVILCAMQISAAAAGETEISASDCDALLQTIADAQSDTVIRLTDDITVDSTVELGNPACHITIAADGAQRRITLGSSGRLSIGSAVTLGDGSGTLLIDGGYDKAAGAGTVRSVSAIEITAGGTLTMSGVTVHGVNNTSTSSYGGAVRMVGGTLTLDGAVFSGNTAERGSAIWASAGAHVTASAAQFRDNTVRGVATLYAIGEGTEVTLLGTDGSILFESNHSEYEKTGANGGISIYDGTLTLCDTVMRGNTAGSANAPRDVYIGSRVVNGDVHLGGTLEIGMIAMPAGKTLTLDSEVRGSIGVKPASYQTRAELLTGSETLLARSAECFRPDNADWVVSARTGHLLTRAQAHVEHDAFAYYDHRDGIAYAMVGLSSAAYSKGIGWTMREIYAAPEAATAERTVYLECGGFQLAHYRETFGADTMRAFPWRDTASLISLAKSGGGVYYYDYARNPQGKTAEQIISGLKQVMEPGDLIIYSGHVMMFVDDAAPSGALIDCGTTDGYIRYRKLNDYLFNSASGSAYLLADGHDEIAVVRVLNGITAEFTENSEARYELGRLCVSKASGLPDGQSVQPGQNVTFTITLDNAPKLGTAKPVTVTVSESLPDGAVLQSISSSGELVGDTILFRNISVPAGTTLKLTYTVKAGQTGAIRSGETEIRAAGSENALTLRYRDIEIGTGMTASQRTKLQNIVTAAVADGTLGTKTPLEWVNDAYTQVLGHGLGAANDAQIFTAVFAPLSDGKYRIEAAGAPSEVLTAVVRHSVAANAETGVCSAPFAGGYYVMNTTETEDITRVRSLRDFNMQFGDVLAVQDWNGEYVYYIYTGTTSTTRATGGTLVRLAADGVTEIKTKSNSSDTTGMAYQSLVGRSGLKEISSRLFVLLRPSKLYDPNHTLNKVEASAASCTEAGNSAYYVCSCGKFFEDAAHTHEIKNGSWIIPALNHRYVQQPDGAIVCAVCDAEMTFAAAAQYVGSRGGTLTLCEDTETAYLMLGSDAMLDLGGSTLTVTNGLSVSKGGTVKNGTLRIRSGAVAELNDNGGFVPVWTKTEGGYAYYTLCSLEMKLGKTVERYENGAKYTFGYKFAEYPAYALAINANANTDLKFGAELTVRNGEDSLRMDSSFSKGSIAKMDEVEDELTAFYKISLRITGASPDRFSAAPMVKSKSIGYRMSGAK